MENQPSVPGDGRRYPTHQSWASKMKRVFTFFAISFTVLWVFAIIDRNSVADDDAAYERLLKRYPAIGKKIARGDATKDDVIVWMRGKRGTKGGARTNGDELDNRRSSFPATAFEYAAMVEPELGVPPRIDLDESVEIPIYVDGIQKYGNLGKSCDNPSFLGKDTMSGSTLQ